jgi:hypothetical protein
MGDDERYDPLLLNIAQRCTEGFPELLDVFLGFLRRKTDAFDPPGGYPQLEKAFVGALKRQYEAAQRKKAAKAAASVPSKKVDAKTTATAAPSAAIAAPTSAVGAPKSAAAELVAAPKEEVIEMNADGSFDLTAKKSGGSASSAAFSGASEATAASVAAASASGAEPAKPAGAGTARAAGGASSAPSARSAGPSEAGSAAAVSAHPSAQPSAARADADATTHVGGAGGSSEVGDSGEGGKGAKPVGNGGVTDRYTWTQTLGDVTVLFQLPAETKSRDVTVDIKNRSIRVLLRGRAGPLLEGSLHKRVKPEDCTWTLGACVAPLLLRCGAAVASAGMLLLL